MWFCINLLNNITLVLQIKKKGKNLLYCQGNYRFRITYHLHFKVK